MRMPPGERTLKAMNAWLVGRGYEPWSEWPVSLRAAWRELLGDRLGPDAEGSPALTLTNVGPEWWGPDGVKHVGEWPPSVRSFFEEHPEELLT